MPPVSIALVAPYLAPGSIGPRAARSRRLVEGLGAAGQRVGAIVVDDGLAGDGLAGVEVLAGAHGPLVGEMGEPGMNTRRRFRAALAEHARRLVPLPDAHIRWALALARDRALAQKPEGVEAVYAVAAPFSSLVLGAVLGRRWEVPVIGDLGDPWPTRGAAEARLARWTMSRLDALVVTNERTADAYRDQLREGAPILVAPNGADELKRMSGDDPAPPDPPLFLQLGTLSNLRVDPGPSFEALARLDREGKLRFRSHGEAWVRLTPEAARHHLGVIPEDEARTLMRAATALLVVGNRNAIQIPSKVYEIARSDIWALCVSELEREPGSELLRASGHGVVAANAEADIRAAALEVLEREARGERPEPESSHSWEEMLERIVELLPRVPDAPASEPAHGPVPAVRRGLRRARIRAIAARITADGTSRRRLVEMLEQDRYDPPDEPQPVALRALGGARVWLRPGSADSDVAVGAFHGLYHLPSADLQSPRLIWDLGCNIGLTMRQMAAVFPDARIVGVDLDAENLRLAERNIEPVADRCELIEGAIWTEPGQLTYSTPNGEDAYRVTGNGDRAAEAILLDDLRARYGEPDYVKMDIEGAENRVLEERTEWAASVPRIGVEYHVPYDLRECERDLRRLGFDGFEVHRRGLLRRGSDSLYAFRR